MLGEVTSDASAASNHTTAADVLQVFLRGQWTDLDGPAQEARIPDPQNSSCSWSAP